MDALIISDIPTPWREPVFERVHRALNGQVEIVYFHDNERRRLWTFGLGRHPKTILQSLTWEVNGTQRFLNLGIVPLLCLRRPRIALVCASLKDPTTWLALGLCRLLGTRVALIADTWLGRDREIGALQRLARQIVYNSGGHAYVGASIQTLAMFRHYNRDITEQQCFLSHLVADNSHFQHTLGAASLERPFDVMFAGRIVRSKNPVFFARVCAGIRAARGSCRALIMGDGDSTLMDEMRRVFDEHEVSYEFAGFIPHAELPRYYAQSRLLMLPTAADCWGVVINEAMLAGTPVIASRWTAAVGELLLDSQNGRVLPLDITAWVDAAATLLSDEPVWNAYSECARRTVAAFNYERAAVGILDAFAYLRGDHRALDAPRETTPPAVRDTKDTSEFSALSG